MSDNFIANYLPDDFTIILSKDDFVHRVTGFADGTFISMGRITPSSTPYQGAGDNSFARVKRSKTAMNVTITLHQGSPSNTLFQQLQLADAGAKDNSFVFNCTMKDLSGQTVASSNSAVIVAPANASFGTEFGTRDWGIYLFGSDIFIGGNTPLAPSEVAAMEALGGTVDARWRLNP